VPDDQGPVSPQAISAEADVENIRAAVEARRDPDFKIKSLLLSARPLEDMGITCWCRSGIERSDRAIGVEATRLRNGGILPDALRSLVAEATA
jgi:hypothetical protein